MKKGYWVGCYREILDQEKLTKYAELAGPAILKAGGKFLVRGIPTKTYEHGLKERTVVIEFDNLEVALRAHQSDEYAAALEALDGGAIRDIRVIEGFDNSTIWMSLIW